MKKLQDKRKRDKSGALQRVWTKEAVVVLATSCVGAVMLVLGSVLPAGQGTVAGPGIGPLSGQPEGWRLPLWIGALFTAGCVLYVAGVILATEPGGDRFRRWRAWVVGTDTAEAARDEEEQAWRRLRRDVRQWLQRAEARVDFAAEIGGPRPIGLRRRTLAAEALLRAIETRSVDLEAAQAQWAEIRDPDGWPELSPGERRRRGGTA